MLNTKADAGNRVGFVRHNRGLLPSDIGWVHRDSEACVMWLAKRFLAVAATALTLTVAALADPPAPPAQPAQPAPQQIPWANKFFLPDIGTNRDQTAPAVITHNFGDV